MRLLEELVREELISKYVLKKYRMWVETGSN
jgi:hypothetical protein